MEKLTKSVHTGGDLSQKRYFLIWTLDNEVNIMGIKRNPTSNLNNKKYLTVVQYNGRYFKLIREADINGTTANFLLFCVFFK